jgi:mRNA interferase MazF
MGVKNPSRGEIYRVRLDPTTGSEMKKTRPAVIVSDDVINGASEVVIVCPITGYSGKESPIHILIKSGTAGLGKDSVAHCGQIRAIDKVRLIERQGVLDGSLMARIDRGLQHALSL